MTPFRKSNSMMKLLNSSLIDLPTPINISMWWNYGSILGLFLMIQIITGFFLSIHYSPNINMAFSSLIHIIRDTNWGWLTHSIHMNGASTFMLFMYIHIGRNIYYHTYNNNMETWNIGVTIFIMSMATAFMGYVLPWGQMSFWGATVITNIFSAIPFIGNNMVQWMWGGFAVSNATLNRFFSIHFMLPMLLVMLVVIHLMLLHEKGSSNPLGLNSNADRIPFHIYFSSKDMMSMMIFTLMFLTMSLLSPHMLSDPENFIEANPLITPTHIQPEWYFLWLYAILRSIPNKIGGVLALMMALMVLYILPMMKNNKLSMSNYPVSQFMFYLLLSSWMMLEWVGACPVEQPYTTIAQMSTTLYFMYFIMIHYMNNMWNNLLL